ncbi:MAG: teichoic acid transporter [Bifidobacterium sp.]|nr:teichoic acid transporter [Bifidobacterium sp.]
MTRTSDETDTTRKTTAIRTPSAQEAAVLRALDEEPAPRPTEPDSGQEMEANLVSKHPEATIPESDVSLADIERQRSHPWLITGAIVLVLAALIAPYWGGRAVAVNHTGWVTDRFGSVDARGILLVSWAVTTFAIVSLVMMIVDRYRAVWFSLFIVLLAGEQFIAGVGVLKFNFWYSTYVIYGDHARVANAANIGIIASALAVAVFAVVWVGMLIAIKKDSPLNVLTHVWTSLIMLFVFEVLAVLIAMFGGFTTVV